MYVRIEFAQKHITIIQTIRKYSELDRLSSWRALTAAELDPYMD